MNEKQLSEEFSKLLTGDIIIMSGDSFLSRVVRFGEYHGFWTHVGIVVRDPDFLTSGESRIGLYFLNSDGSYQRDIESGKKFIGVQMNDLYEKIRKYGKGCIAIRKLYLTEYSRKDHNENIRRNELLKPAYVTEYHKIYDYLPSDLMAVALNKRGFHFLDQYVGERHLDHIFCSALVAYSYCEMGVMNEDTPWSFYTPDDFGKNFHTMLPLNETSYLGPAIVIETDTQIDGKSIIHDHELSRPMEYNFKSLIEKSQKEESSSNEILNELKNELKNETKVKKYWCTIL